MGGKLSLIIKSLSKDQQAKSAVRPSQGIMELMHLKNYRKRQSKKPLPVGEWTLKDWLQASPEGDSSLMRPEECFNGGELYVFKQSSKRIHPSSSSSARVLSEASSVEDPSMSRSQSGRLKKRVRFKLPEEAEIILFYSPRETRE